MLPIRGSKAAGFLMAKGGLDSLVRILRRGQQDHLSQLLEVVRYLENFKALDKLLGIGG